MAYFKFTDMLRKGETIRLFNYGNCKRDFTYVDDITEGILRVMGCAPERRQGTDGLPHRSAFSIQYRNSHPVNLLEFVDILHQELIGAGCCLRILILAVIRSWPLCRPAMCLRLMRTRSRWNRILDLSLPRISEQGSGRFAEWYRDFYSGNKAEDQISE